MRKYLLILGTILFLSNCAHAQQSRVYSQFFMNPFVYNPAYAGVEGHSVVFAMYRQQWLSIDGAPAISHISFHTPLKGGLGLGATVYNESEGLINTVGGKASASYLWSIDRKHYLRMGMSLGAGNQFYDTEGFDSPADPAFADLNSSFFTIAEFGATYHFDHFNIGFALPNLIGYDVVTSESFSKPQFKPLNNMLLKANYRGHVNDDFAFEPHILYRYFSDEPNQFEASLITHIKHLIWLGGSYRQDAGFVALFGTKIKEFMAVGFAYDVGNLDYAGQIGPTFEAHIGIHLGSKKRHAEHVSSFIKSHRKSLEEREREKAQQLARQKALEEQRQKALQEARAEKLRKEQEAAAAAAAAALAEKARKDSIENANKTIPDTNPVDTDPVDVTDNTENISSDPVTDTEDPVTDTENPVTNAEDPVTDTEDPVTNTEDPITDTEDPVNVTQDPVTDTEDPADTSTDNNEVTSDTRSIDELAASDSPKRVKRGNHLLELRHGYYVVAGVYDDFDRAEEFSDELFEKGSHDVIVGYLTQEKKYYVVVYRSESLTQAQTERTRLKQRTGFSKVWLLSVE